MDDRPVLITGVAGFIGSHAATLLTQAGAAVIGVDSAEPSRVNLNLARYESLTLPDPSLANLLADERPRALVHCAGRASVPRSIAEPGDDYRTNAAMTFETLDALRLHVPDCHFLFPSSAAVYGNPSSMPITEDAPPAPISPYGFHKLQAELLCRESAVLHGLRTTVLRIFSAYGPGLRRQVMWDMCQKALTEDELMLQGEGTESRDFIHVDDIAAALAHLISAGPQVGFSVYNLGGEAETRVADLAQMLLDALGLQLPIRFQGTPTRGAPSNWLSSTARLRATGFAPARGIAEGVAEYARWARDEILRA